jgi:hypothetical protein
VARRRKEEDGVIPLTIHEVLSERASAVAELFSVEPAPGSTLAEVKRVVAEATPKELQLWPNVLSFYDRYGPFILFAQLVDQRLNALAHKAADYAQQVAAAATDPAAAREAFRKAISLVVDGMPYAVAVTTATVHALISLSSTVPLSAFAHSLAYGKLPITGGRTEPVKLPGVEEEEGKKK